ncbi:MAG: tetratricopeptide repeat protein [Cellvibrionaceae bacterium]|nr:tetratricopeptide repeat protein [Cellvibrionaceae bacterium]
MRLGTGFWNRLEKSAFSGIAVLLAIPTLAAAPKMEIQFSPPTFVLPQFTGPYQEREASIATSEYEKAEQLRELLDAGKRREVLAELEKFYSIELSPAMLMLQAQIYFSLDMHDKAEATYLDVLKRMPQLIRAHADLGQLYLKKEQLQKAREHFARAVALGSDDALIHGQLGYLNLTQFGAYSAISSYQRAAALEPDNLQWQQGLLAALTQARMFESAQALLNDIISRKPNLPALWLNQAALALNSENYRSALTSLEMAALLGDKDPRNLKTLAKLHLQLGSYDRAIELLDEGLRQNYFDGSGIDEYFSWLTRQGMWDKAEQMLKIVSRNMDRLSQDEKSQYHVEVAQVAAHKGDDKKAQTAFRQALELNPASGSALVAYGNFLTQRKVYVEAELIYMRAESVAGVEKQALLGRAQLYIQMQDYSAALTQLRAVMQKFPEMAHLKDNIETLENILKTQS